MKLHLPFCLRKALLACLAAGAFTLPPTLSTATLGAGTALVTFALASQQARAEFKAGETDWTLGKVETVESQNSVLTDVDYEYKVDYSNGTVTVQARNTDGLVWDADDAANNTWQVDGNEETSPWMDDAVYSDGDNVTFDSKDGQINVTVSGTVAPGSITLSGANGGDFTGDGSGKITVGNKLIVSGGGTWNFAPSVTLNGASAEANTIGGTGTVIFTGGLTGNGTGLTIGDGNNELTVILMTGIGDDYAITVDRQFGAITVKEAATLVIEERYSEGFRDVLGCIGGGISGEGTVRIVGNEGDNNNLKYYFTNKNYTDSIYHRMLSAGSGTLANIEIGGEMRLGFYSENAQAQADISHVTNLRVLEGGVLALIYGSNLLAGENMGSHTIYLAGNGWADDDFESPRPIGTHGAAFYVHGTTTVNWAVSLSDDAHVKTLSGTTTITGSFDGQGKKLTKIGDGSLILGNVKANSSMALDIQEGHISLATAGDLTLQRVSLASGTTLTLAGGSIALDGDGLRLSQATGKLVVTGSITLTGKLTLDVTGTSESSAWVDFTGLDSTVDLSGLSIMLTGTGTGENANLAGIFSGIADEILAGKIAESLNRALIGADYEYKVDYSSGTVTAQAKTTDGLVWDASDTANNTWQVSGDEGTSPWTDNAVYKDGDNVIFNSANETLSIIVSGTVAPGNITLRGANGGDFMDGGSGKITVGSKLIVSGGGTWNFAPTVNFGDEQRVVAIAGKGTVNFNSTSGLRGNGGELIIGNGADATNVVVANGYYDTGDNKLNISEVEIRANSSLTVTNAADQNVVFGYASTDSGVNGVPTIRGEGTVVLVGSTVAARGDISVSGLNNFLYRMLAETSAGDTTTLGIFQLGDGTAAIGFGCSLNGTNLVNYRKAIRHAEHVRISNQATWTLGNDDTGSLFAYDTAVGKLRENLTNKLVLAGGTLSTKNATIDWNLTLEADSTFAVAAGKTATVNGTYTTNGNTLTKTGDGSLTLGNVKAGTTMELDVQAGHTSLTAAESLTLQGVSLASGTSLTLAGKSIALGGDGLSLSQTTGKLAVTGSTTLTGKLTLDVTGFSENSAWVDFTGLDSTVNLSGLTITLIGMGSGENANLIGLFNGIADETLAGKIAESLNKALIGTDYEYKVDYSSGTVTTQAKTSLVWDASDTVNNTWQVNGDEETSPWMDDAVYSDRDNVTFDSKDRQINVTVSGTVVPDKVTLKGSNGGSFTGTPASDKITFRGGIILSDGGTWNIGTGVALGGEDATSFKITGQGKVVFAASSPLTGNGHGFVVGDGRDATEVWILSSVFSSSDASVTELGAVEIKENSKLVLTWGRYASDCDRWDSAGHVYGEGMVVLQSSYVVNAFAGAGSILYRLLGDTDTTEEGYLNYLQIGGDDAAGTSMTFNHNVTSDANTSNMRTSILKIKNVRVTAGNVLIIGSKDGRAHDIFEYQDDAGNIAHTLLLSGSGISNAGAFVLNTDVAIDWNTTLENDTTISVAAGKTATVNGTYTGNGNMLTKIGAGALILGNVAVGSTMGLNVQEGELSVTSASGEQLTLETGTTIAADATLTLVGEGVALGGEVAGEGTLKASGTVNVGIFLGGFNGTLEAEAGSTLTLSGDALTDGELAAKLGGSGTVAVDTNQNPVTFSGSIEETVELKNAGGNALIVETSGGARLNGGTGGITLGSTDMNVSWEGSVITGGDIILSNVTLGEGGFRSKAEGSRLLVDTAPAPKAETATRAAEPQGGVVDVNGMSIAGLDGITINADGTLKGLNGGTYTVGSDSALSMTFTVNNWGETHGAINEKSALLQGSGFTVALREGTASEQGLQLAFDDDVIRWLREKSKLYLKVFDGGTWGKTGGVTIDWSQMSDSVAQMMDIVVGDRYQFTEDGLKLTGSTEDLYVVMDGDLSDPDTLTDPAELAEKRAVAVLDGKTLSLSRSGGTEAQLTVPNLLGSEGTKLKITNTAEAPTTDRLNVTLDNTYREVHDGRFESLPEAEGTTVRGQDTTFLGSIQGGEGVDITKTGAGTLTVGGNYTLADGTTTLDAGALVLRGEQNTMEQLVFSYDAEPLQADPEKGVKEEKRGLTLGDGSSTTIGSIAEEGRSSTGNEVRLGKGAKLTLTGDISATPLVSTALSGDGTGTLELGDTSHTGAQLAMGGNSAIEGIGVLLNGQGTLSLQDNAVLSAGTVRLNDTSVLELAGVLNIVKNLQGAVDGTLRGIGAATRLSITDKGVESSFSGTLAGGGTLTVCEGVTLKLTGVKTETESDPEPVARNAGGLTWNIDVEKDGTLDVTPEKGKTASLGIVTLYGGANLVYHYNEEADHETAFSGILKKGGDAGTKAMFTVEFEDGDVLDEKREITLGGLIWDKTLGDIEDHIKLVLKGDDALYYEQSGFKMGANGKVLVGIKEQQQNLYFHANQEKNAAAGAELLWNAANPNGSGGNRLHKDGDIYKLSNAVQEQYNAVQVRFLLSGADENAAAAAAAASLDTTLAAVAGASISTLGQALAEDLHRQLRSIRNRTTGMGAEARCDLDGTLPLYHAWVNAETGYHKQDADGLAPGYTLNNWGGTLGLEMDVRRNVTVGLAISAMYGDLKTESADNGRGDLDTTYMSAFLRGTAGAWTHTVVISGGMADIDFNRTVTYLGGSYRADGNTDGYAIGALYEVGYSRLLNAKGTVAVQPVFNVGMRHVGINGYSESGTDAGLRVDDISQNIITLGAGARIQALAGTNIFNRSAVVEGRALVKADVGDRNGKVTNAILDAAQGREVESAEVGAVGIEIGAGINIPLGATKGSIFVDGSLEWRSGYTSMDASVGYRSNF